MTDTHEGAPARRFARLRRLPVWLLLPGCALAGATAGGAYGVLRPAEYTATSYVIAVPTEKSDPATALGFAQAYGRVATQLAVLGDAQVAARLPVAELRSRVRAETSPDAPMVAISATAGRPARAADIANAVSRALTLNANRTEDRTRVQLLQFSRALRPVTPSSAGPVTTALVGGSAGGLLGGLALLTRPRRRAPEPSAPAPVPAPAPAADLQR
ncbi:lipopolysaccharide biosynthesis protein [Streptomyces sp. NPDC049906]|uniref:lipopolysaccharide biosynthesis protein n=1 Tax=Streptomyces sp. NPDC049906 TaxID=3155656 RepID=UPI0034446CA7